MVHSAASRTLFGRVAVIAACALPLLAPRAARAGGPPTAAPTPLPYSTPLAVPTSPTPSAIVTPEPATLALVGVGALVLGGITRRRTRRNR